MTWKKFFKQLEFPESYISITLGFLVVIVAGILAYNYFTKNRTGQITTTDKKTEIKLDETGKPVEITTLPTTYTVAAGDNLWKIAEKFYGSGYNWVSIAAENKLTDADNVEAGQKLSIPKAEVIRPVTGQISDTAARTELTYTVVKGDNLWNIAIREYGDGFAWTKIAQVNSLANPDLIHPGNILKIPRT